MPSLARLDAIRDIAEMLSSRRGPWKQLLDPDDVDPIRAASRLLSDIRQGTIKHATESEVRASSRVLHRLTLQVLMIDVAPPDDSGTWTQTYHALRDLVAVIALLAYGRRSAAMHVLSGVHERVTRQQLTFAEIICLRLLRVHASLEGAVRKVDRLDRELHRLLEIEALENEAESYEERVSASLSRTSSRRSREARRTQAYAERVDGSRRMHDRYVLHITYFRLAARGYQQEGDDEATVRVCREARAYYRRHPEHASPTRIGEFVIKELVCLISLRRIKDASKLIEQLRATLSVNASYWAVILRYVYQLSMLQLDLSGAAKACMEYRAIESKVRTQGHGDTWRFNEAFVQVAARIGIGNGEDATMMLGSTSFYLGNLRKRLASLARDKQGVDVGLQILTILHWVDVMRYSDIMTVHDALAKYVKRNVREPTLRRSNIFLRLLLSLPRHDFDPIALRRSGADLRRELVELRVDDDAEIIPYEHVWDAVLTTLERNSRSERRRR